MTVKKKLLIVANVPFENTLDTGSDLCGAWPSDALDVYVRLKGGENSIKVDIILLGVLTKFFMDEEK